MSAKGRTDVKALEKRIRELEEQLERAQMKNVALNTMKVLVGILFHSYHLYKTQN